MYTNTKHPTPNAGSYGMQCPNCGATAPEDNHFCEECGTSLATRLGDAAAASDAGACRCGAGLEARDAHGYCTQCGRRWQTPGRDHVKLPLAPHFAAVTDRGLRHPRNEDDVTIAMKDIAGKTVYVMTVCDGVSSSQIPDTASALAAGTVEKALLSVLQAGAEQLEKAIAEAILEAHAAVSALPYTPGGTKSPPSTTIVTATVADGVATIGWVGDSRAYWLGGDEVRMLTHDHSWINQMVDAGQMTQEEAEQAPEAHAITQCLGLVGDGEPEEPPVPSTLSFALPGAGNLLLCSDGLWNYAPTAAQLAEFIKAAPPTEDVASVCSKMVEYALAQGGRDNVTVAILKLGL
jgi:serine/threonine protein phosphatase PrpC